MKKIFLEDVQNSLLTNKEYLELIKTKERDYDWSRVIDDYEKSDQNLEIDLFANIIHKKFTDSFEEKSSTTSSLVKKEVVQTLNSLTGEDYSLKVFHGLESSQKINLVNNAFVDTSNMWKEIIKHIDISQEIYLISPFLSTIALCDLENALKNRCTKKPLKLTILSTTYDGKMQYLSLDGLKKLYESFNNDPLITIEIRIEDARQNRSQRLHSKSFIFKNSSNFGVAFVGSANFTNTGLRTGTEWNLKITEFHEPKIFNDIMTTFYKIWDRPNLYRITDDIRQFDLLLKAKQDLKKIIPPQSNLELNYDAPKSHVSEHSDIVLKPYQKEALNHIIFERNTAKRSHLLIMATGTGKTITAASDFAKLKESNSEIKLLFIAERMELLEQALATYRHVLHDSSFGDIYHSKNLCDLSNTKDLFITLDMLNNAEKWALIKAKKFTNIVFDEVHHIHAPTYQKVIKYYQTQNVDILGLTATPTREDGIDIKTYFDNQYSYELSLWKAIQEGYLASFNYFTIKDNTIDLSGLDLQDEIKINEKLMSEKRQEFVWENYQNLTTEQTFKKTIVFCYSIVHAEKVCYFLSSKGALAAVLTSKASLSSRTKILEDFRKGPTEFLCVVDILNEGVDLPDINNVLFLRPTESKTIFIQQMGRGLRKRGNKILNILDFVNNIDLSINKKIDPLMRLNSLINTDINTFSLTENNFLETINNFLPRESNFIMWQQDVKMIIDRLKIFQNQNCKASDLKNISINSYEDYAAFLKNNYLEPINIYPHGLTKIRSFGTFLLRENKHLNLPVSVMQQFLFLNNFYLLKSFQEILINKKLSSDELINNLFIVSFLPYIVSKNALQKFLKTHQTESLTNYIFSFQNEKLREEILYLITYRLETETNNLLFQKDDYRKTFFTWQQSKALAWFADYRTWERWNIMRTSGFETIKEPGGPITIYTDAKSDNNYKDFYYETLEKLRWYAPGGPSGWKKSKPHKDREKMWDPSRRIYCFHKPQEVTKKYGNKFALYQFIGFAQIENSEWFEDNQEIYELKMTK